MGGIASPNPMMVPPVMNPILAEIDAAHANLSPDAQAAIEKAHGIAAPAGIAAPNGHATEPPPGGGIQAPAPTTVGAGITPPGTATAGLYPTDLKGAGQTGQGTLGDALGGGDDNVSSAAIKPAGALGVPSLGSKMPEAAPTPIGTGKVSSELARITAPDNHQHDKTNTGTPGVNQIHNPWARVPLQILDALGRGFFPGVEMALPGTSGHHDVLVHQRQVEDTEEQNAAKAQTEEELQRAQAAHANAEAETAGQNNKQGLIKVGPGEGIYDPKTKTWVEEPTATQLKNVTEVDPEIGKTIGIKPTADGRYLVPNTALGDLVKAKIPAPKESKTPTNETEYWIQQHKADNNGAGGTPDELHEFLSKATKQPQWSAEDRAIISSVGGDVDKPETLTKPVLAAYLKTKKTETPKTALVVGDDNVVHEVGAGSHLPGNARSIAGVSGENVSTAKGVKAAEEAVKYGQDYVKSGQFSGPKDEALLEAFFEVAKPSSGFRMTQPQIDMLMKGRSWMESAEGIAYHAKTGVWFPPEQRQQIVDAMQARAESKGVKPQGGGGQIPQPSNKAEYDALPKGAHYMKDGQEKVKQ